MDLFFRLYLFPFYLLLLFVCVCAGRTWLIIYVGLLFYTSQRERTLSLSLSRGTEKKKRLMTVVERKTRARDAHELNTFSATLRRRDNQNSFLPATEKTLLSLTHSLPLFWSRATANGICQRRTSKTLSLSPTHHRWTEASLSYWLTDGSQPPERWKLKGRTRLWSIPHTLRLFIYVVTMMK